MLDCVICIGCINDNASDPNNYPWVVSCGHIYHKQCIQQIIRDGRPCPVCRRPITTNFRVYPKLNSEDDTVKYLQDCVKSAELQYERQKRISDDKDAQITRIQTLNEEVETRNTELRTINVNFVEAVEKIKEKLNTNIAKLKKEKDVLNKKVPKLEEKISRHETTISDLKTSLKEKEDQLAAASEAQEVAKNSLRQLIQGLQGQLESYKLEVSSRDKANREQISKLQGQLDDLRLQYATACEAIKCLSDRPAPRGPDPAVDALARGLEAAKIAIPHRKRKSSTDALAPYNKKTETSPQKSGAEAEGVAPDATKGSEQESRPGAGGAGAAKGEAPAPQKYYARKIIKVVKKSQ